jgi:hypothetical protein
VTVAYRLSCFYSGFWADRIFVCSWVRGSKRNAPIVHILRECPWSLALPASIILSNVLLTLARLCHLHLIGYPVLVVTPYECYQLRKHFIVPCRQNLGVRDMREVESLDLRLRHGVGCPHG